MKDILLILAKAGDEKIIHSMKYSSFLPLYNLYKDDETSPVKESIDKIITQLKSDNTDYYIITTNSKPIGAIRIVDDGFENNKHFYRISPLFIIPEYQNYGIGYSTIKMIFDMYKSADIWRLSTIKQEKGNCHLYEKCGFKLVGKEKIVNDKMTIVYYEKRIKY